MVWGGGAGQREVGDGGRVERQRRQRRDGRGCTGDRGRFFLERERSREVEMGLVWAKENDGRVGLDLDGGGAGRRARV